MLLARFIALLRTLSVWLFWPGLMLVVWGELKPSTHPLEFTLWDKLLHFTAYFGLAAMATMALRPSRKAAWAVLALIVFGGVMEIVQGMVGRDADILDELANSLGAISGGAVAWAFWHLRSKLVGASPEA